MASLRLPADERSDAPGAPSFSCRSCPVRGIAFCAGLTPAGRDRLEQTVVRWRAGKEHVLAAEGAPDGDLVTVIDGVLRLSNVLADGRRVVTAFHLPGELVACGGPARRWQAEVAAVTAVTLCHVDGRSLPALRSEIPELDRRLLALRSDQLATAQARMVLLARMTPVEKLAFFLVDMMHRRRPVSAGEAGVLPMGRDDLADYLGLQAETVSRAFSRLSADGIVSLPRPSRVVIEDLRRLEALASGGGRGDPRGQGGAGKAAGRS